MLTAIKNPGFKLSKCWISFGYLNTLILRVKIARVTRALKGQKIPVRFIAKCAIRRLCLVFPMQKHLFAKLLSCDSFPTQKFGLEIMI
jgi:hypothetical protein